MADAIADTNVHVYSYDPSDPYKQQQALALIRRLVAEDNLVVSVQILNEFAARITRPNKPPALSYQEAARAVEDIVSTAIVLPLTISTLLLALNAVPRHGFHFWDALIWAVAKENGMTTIYTEDIPSAPVIEGVRYINPFVSAS
jgi:predicted nucleic acid-binding protein